jgi:hypothetical protein
MEYPPDNGLKREELLKVGICNHTGALQYHPAGSSQ